MVSGFVLLPAEPLHVLSPPDGREKVWLMLRTATVSKTESARVHGTEVSYPITTGGTPHIHAHRNPTHITAGVPPSVPTVCLLLGNKAGLYVRKRLVSEPGVQREPHCLWWAVYMLKLLKDIKRCLLFGRLTSRCRVGIDVEAFRTANEWLHLPRVTDGLDLFCMRREDGIKARTV